MKSLNRVVLQLTKKCNLACSHCFFNASSSNDKKLTLNQTSKALSDLHNLGFKKIGMFILTGGEPTLWPYLSSLMINIRKSFPKAKIRIDTNGLNFLINPKLFKSIGADIYDISVDEFHNQAIISGKFKNKDLYITKDGTSQVVDIFLKNKAKYNFELSIRWTSDRQDDNLFDKFFKKYHKKVNIEKKLVTATGRGKNLPHKSTDSGYLIKDKPSNFACLMGDSWLLAINGCWYGCYHPVGLTKLGKAGDKELTENFNKLINLPLYNNLPKQGLLKVLNDIRKNNPEKREIIEKILTKKYWYRCEPCEDLCRLGIFKLQ